MSSDMRTPVCPGCQQPPLFLMGGGRQAFCGDEDCRVITWDPASSPEEFWNTATPIRLTTPPTEGTPR